MLVIKYCLLLLFALLSETSLAQNIPTQSVTAKRLARPRLNRNGTISLLKTVRKEIEKGNVRWIFL